MVINKKFIRSKRSDVLRFIGSILVIALCICMYVSFTSSMWSLYYNLIDYRADNSLHDYEVYVSGEIPNVSELEGKYSVLLEYRRYCEIKCDDGDIIRLMSANSKVDKYVVVEGADISDRNDVLLNEQYAEKNGYGVGSSIKIGDNTFTVRGYYIEPDFTLVTNSLKGISVNHTAYGIGIVSKERAAEMPQMAGEYLVCCGDDKDSFDKEGFLKDVFMSARIEQVIDRESDNRAVYIDGDVMIYTKGMAVIPFALMIVACFVVAVILGKLLKSETVEIGILYSFGYKPFQLYRHYTFYSFFIAICGGALGIALGMLIAPLLKSIVTDRYCVPSFDIALEAKTVLVALVMPLAFLVTICSVVVISKLSQSPLTLLRNQTSDKSKPAFRGFVPKNASFTSKFRMREILRNIPKYLFMIFGVAMSALMLLLFATILGSINKMMDDSFSNIFKYEYMYTYKDMMVGKPDGYRTNLAYYMLGDEEVSVNGVDVGNTHMCFNDGDGNPVTFEDHGITANLARKHGVSAGDTVVIKHRITGDEYSIKIDRIVMSYAEDFICMPLDEFNEFFGFPEDSYIIVTSDKELDIDADKLLSVNSKQNSRSSIDETLAPVRGIMLAMMGMAAITAFVLMVIVISIILEDSRTTISLLKILGYSDKRISRMMLDFNRYVVIISFAVSLPLILLASSKIMETLSEMMGMYIPPYLNPVHAVIGFALLYLVFVVTKLVMQRKILSVDPAETLKSNE